MNPNQSPFSYGFPMVFLWFSPGCCISPGCCDLQPWWKPAVRALEADAEQGHCQAENQRNQQGLEEEATDTWSISGKGRFHHSCLGENGGFTQFFSGLPGGFFVEVSCEVYRWKNPCWRNVELKLFSIYIRSVEVGCVQLEALTNMQNLHSWLPYVLLGSWTIY